MDIKKLDKVNQDETDQINVLLGQLTLNYKILSLEDISKIISSGSSILIVSKHDNKICAIVCLSILKTLTSKKCQIEDLVVNSNYRNKGIASRLIDYCINYCLENNIKYIDLTSNPKRIAANNLYKKKNFLIRETNIYRYTV